MTKRRSSSGSSRYVLLVHKACCAKEYARFDSAQVAADNRMKSYWQGNKYGGGGCPSPVLGLSCTSYHLLIAGTRLGRYWRHATANRFSPRKIEGVFGFQWTSTNCSSTTDIRSSRFPANEATQMQCHCCATSVACCERRAQRRSPMFCTLARISCGLTLYRVGFRSFVCGQFQPTAAPKGQHRFKRSGKFKRGNSGSTLRPRHSLEKATVIN